MTPLVVFFGWEFGEWYKGKNPSATAGQLPLTGEPKTEAIDESRRKFLKIAAGTSLATAAMYFLNRQKAGAAFFGSMPGPGTVALKDASGNKISPAVNLPTEGFGIANIEEHNYPNYYGYVRYDGGWYILKLTSATVFVYASGQNNDSYKGNFTDAWTNKSDLSYGNYNEAF